ncbi:MULTISPECIES: ComEC/Rec2 family competence protein [Clostridium]|uniref:ComE operon protein 3 n=1 Tax=Clostridium novyi (strain NT) TaxID=386415 RepID=A0Q1S4_CLONN|nr:ComE operon protein 3 [Clostridium novyi NT]KEH88004.1 competence protein ComE [Clostridium novyi A str. NCTC 538]KEH93738.1 competence protein ComE [Clostridium botulinum C/D str. It1]
MTRPLIYYALSIYLASFTLIMCEKNILVAIILVLMFFSLLFFTMDMKYFMVIVCFFLLGCFSFYTYFNTSLSGFENKVRVIQIKRGNVVGDYKGRKILLLGDINGVKEGNRIIVDGSFKDKKDYYKGIIGEVKIYNHKKLNSDFIEKLYRFREGLYKKYTKALDKKKAAIIMACCYGDTKYINFNVKDNINKLGISHIISVSGLHIALVYKMIERILGIKGGIVLSFIYMIFTGGKPATIRAYIMILAMKLSKCFYRTYDSLSSLSLAAIIILLMKPYYVVDIGFNLSFLATLGIILYNKKIRRVLYKLPNKINESLSMTFSAQVFSMPYAMCTLNNISVFFILGNLLLVPLYSIIILLGNLVIVVLKFKIPFRIICSFIYSIMTAIEGGTYLLLKITPSMVQYNYFYGVAMLSIFMSYILLRHGYKKAIYFPCFVMCFVLMHSIT